MASNSGSIFGTPAGFGTPAAKKPESGFNFASTGFSLGTSSTTPQSSPAKPPLFGANSSGSSLFGQNPTSSGSPAPANSIFGGSNTNSGPGTTSSGTPNLFGASNTTGSKTPSLFGNAATTSSTSAGLFGGAAKTPGSTTTASNSPGIFGNSGAANNPTGSTTATSNSPSIFGNSGAANSGGSSLFGNKTTPSPSSTPAAASSNTGTSTNQTPAPASQSNIFSATPNFGAQKSNFSGFTPSSGTNTPTTAAPASFSFNASSNTQPAKDTTGTQAPSTTGEASKPASTPVTGSLFGSKPTDNSSSKNTATPTISATPPSSTLPSSPSLFSMPTPSKTNNTNQPEATSKPASNLFGTGGLSVKSTAPAKSSPLATNSSTPGEESQTTSTSTSKTVSSPPATPSTKPNINLAPSLLKGKTLEDLVTRWNSELDERVEEFKQTANEIAAWDQVLVQNGDQISVLYDELQRIEPIQSSIDQTLDYVESQQQELSVALEDYERQLLSNQSQDFSATTGRVRTAAQEREEAYKTAEEVHVQLNDMASSLGTMIAELNGLAGPGNKLDELSNLGADGGSGASAEDPILQIAGILNAHLGSLNWISEITQELGSKVNELESRVSNTKVEFGLESNPQYRQIDYNAEDFIPASTATHPLSSLGSHSGLSHLNGSLSSRTPSGLLSHPRR